MPEERIKKLQQILSVLDASISKREFVESFKVVIQIVKDLRKEIADAFRLIRKTLVDDFKKLSLNNASELATLKKEFSSTISKALKEQQDGMGFIYDKVRNLKNGRDGRDGKSADEIKIIQNVLSRIPAPVTDNAGIIRDKLEDIEVEEDKLKIEAIGYLREELDKLEKRIGDKVITPVFASQRGSVKIYDLSSQLNGVLKTFSLPAFWRVIDIKSSSTPNAFRPTTDYTTDANAMTITFTSQIDAASTLATGQTLLVEYAEP